MLRPTRKDHSLSLRLAASDVALIDRAANLHGRSRADFAREAAIRAAEEAIIDSTLVRMSRAGFKAFADAISGPAKPVPKMVAMLKRKAPWEKASTK